MKRSRIVLIAMTTLLILALFFFGLSIWDSMKPSLSAINYLESKGYTSVRILQNISKESSECDLENDAYRKVFDAIPSDGEKRRQGLVCGGGEHPWYEE